MYERFFGIDELPFQLTPDPRYLFLSSKHREALGHLVYGIREGAGFVCITGEIGAGKTTLLRALLREADDTTQYAYILNPVLTGVELLEEINHELGAPSKGTRRELLAALNQVLVDQRALGRRVVLVIDEAQSLDGTILEQLRLLSNFETESAKLLQIVLVGQPELREVLSRPDLEQLNQRITVRWHLGRMDRAETAQYLAHRVRTAGQTRSLFTRGAIAAIHDHSRGTPRLINVAAHRSLMVAYAANSAQVTRGLARRAIAELRRHLPPNTRAGTHPAVWGAAAVAAAAALALAGTWTWQQRGAATGHRQDAAAGPVGADPSTVAAAAAPPADRASAPAAGSQVATAQAGVASTAGPTTTTAAAPPGGEMPAARPAEDGSLAAGDSAVSPVAAAVARSVAPQGALDDRLALGDRGAQAPVAAVQGEAMVPAVPRGAARYESVGADPAVQGREQAPAGAPVAEQEALAEPAAAEGPTERPESLADQRLLFAEALRQTTVGNSGYEATEALLRAWGAKSLSAREAARSTLDLGSIGRSRGLEYLPIAGNLNLLRALDLPALLEIAGDDGSTARFVTVTRLDDEVAHVLAGRAVVDVSPLVLAESWSGRAHVYWKDVQGMGTLREGSNGRRVRRLHALLRSAGVYEGPDAPVFSAETTDAVTRFQRSRRIVADGKAGPMTMIALYQGLGDETLPRLAVSSPAAEASVPPPAPEVRADPAGAGH